MSNLLEVLEALIDTARRNTDLDFVYNDITGTSVSWEEVNEELQKVREAQ